MSIRSKAISGVKWTTMSIIVTTITQLLSIAILVRYLEKSDFGLMAITMVVRGFADIFMDFGITVAILHKQKISKNEFSSLYWLNMIVGFVLYILILIITPLVTDFYQQELLIYLIPLTCLAIPISSIGRQQKTMQQKNLHFKELAYVEMVSSVLYLFLSVFMAVNGYGLYSLVFPLLLKQLVANILFFYIGSRTVKISFHFNFSETKSFLRIGLYNTVGQIVNYFSVNVDVLIIGKILGAEALGIYNLAKDLVAKPTALLSPILSKVITPIFSKLQNQNESLISAFNKVQTINSFVNGTVFILLALLASPIVLIYYGHGFDKCISIVTILSLYSFLRQFGSSIGMLAIAKGRTDIDMWWNIIVIFITPMFVYVGSLISLVGVAIMLMISAILLMTPSWYIYVKPIISLSFYQYYQPLIKTFKVLLIPSISVLLFNLIIEDLNIYIKFIIAGVLFSFLLFYSVKKLFPYLYIDLKSLILSNK